MVGKIKTYDGSSGKIFDIENGILRNFTAADVVGTIAEGDLCTFSVAWTGMVARATQIKKKEN